MGQGIQRAYRFEIREGLIFYTDTETEQTRIRIRERREKELLNCNPVGCSSFMTNTVYYIL